jgi:hypothetical protein
LIQYHDRLLTLDRSGSWEIEDVGAAKEAPAWQPR